MSGEITVKRREGGSWCVYIDGRFISDHADHAAARKAAAQHQGINHAETARIMREGTL